MNILEKKILNKKQVSICIGCKKLKQKFVYKIYTNKKIVYRYQDENGGRWNGARCQPCYEEHRRLINHKNGLKKPRSEVSYITFKKAYETESIVKEFLESFGFTVMQTTGKGPDLILNDSGQEIKIEVKSAIKFDKYYKISKIKRKREKDDIMAIVLNDGSIHFEPMSRWVAKSVMLTDVIIYNNKNRFDINGRKVSFRHF